MNSEQAIFTSSISLYYSQANEVVQHVWSTCNTKSQRTDYLANFASLCAMLAFPVGTRIEYTRRANWVKYIAGGHSIEGLIDSPQIKTFRLFLRADRYGWFMKGLQVPYKSKYSLV